MISETHHSGVLVLRLEHGPVNAIDSELAEALGERFRSLGDGEGAVVLTGSGKAFSAGVDLRRPVEGGRAYVDRFLPRLVEAFRSVAECPVPVVAAVNGPAVAGGCVLACAADLRVVASERGRLGLTELVVGVPFPGVAIDIVREVVGPAVARRLVLRGEVLGAVDALHAGLADEVVPDEDVVETAVRRATELGALGPRAFAIAKRQLRRERNEALSEEVLDVWRSEETRDAMAAFLDRLRRR